MAIPRLNSGTNLDSVAGPPAVHADHGARIDSNAKDTQVLIVGGGLAGMVTALQLERRGISYRVLEAQSRFGGRILSLPLAGGAAFGVDLGPTWFWPHQRRMRQLCDELGCAVFTQHVAGDVLYQQSSRQPVQRGGAGEGMLSYRLAGGMQTLIAAIAARLDPSRLHPGQAVTRVERHEDGWRVTTAAGSADPVQDAADTPAGAGGQRCFHGKHLVLAAPPRRLMQIPDLSRFLPAGLAQALSVTPTWMAAQAKFVAVYPAPFWRQDGLSGQVFSRVGPMGEIHDASAGADTGFALFGFIGVPAGVRSQHAAEVLERACLDQLISVFGARAGTPEVTWLKDWAQDPWVATDADLRESPRHPELDLTPWLSQLRQLQLHFAGSEVAAEEGGYLEGALGSVEALLRSSGIVD
jgi:monoamine oxidase